MISLLVLTFLGTVYTGPAFDDWRDRRRARRDRPDARVTYLPSGGCR